MTFILRFICLLAFLCAAKTASHAQSLISKSGPTQKFKADEKIIDKFTTPDNRTYILRWKLSTVTLDYFDQNLVLIKSAKFELPKYKSRWPVPLRILATESKVVIIVFLPGDDQYLLALPVNPQTLEYSTAYVHLGTQTGYVGNRDYQFAVSPGGKYFAVTLFSMEDNESAIPSHYPGAYDLLVLNAELGMVTIAKMDEYSGNWRRTITGITVTDEGLLLASVKVQSAIISAFENFWTGTVSIHAEQGWLIPYNPFSTAAETRKKRGSVSTRMELHQFETGSTSPKITKVNVPGKTLLTLSIVSNADGTYQLSGLYADKGPDVVCDTQVVKNRKIDSTIAMSFRQTVNGFFVLPATRLDSVVIIQQAIKFNEPVAYDEMNITRYSGSRNTFFTIVAQIVIRELFRSKDDEWFAALEVQGERVNPGQGFNFDYAVTPFAGNAYILQLNNTDTSCTPMTIVKHQILRFESMRLTSIVTLMDSETPVVYYNSFTYEDREYFSAFSLSSSIRKITQTKPENGLQQTTEVSDPELKQFWILSPAFLRNGAECKIAVVTNADAYKLVQFR